MIANDEELKSSADEKFIDKSINLYRILKESLHNNYIQLLLENRTMSFEYNDGTFGELNLRNLGVDQAYINITSYSTFPAWIYTVSDDCVACPLAKLRDVAPYKHITPKIDTSRNFVWKLFNIDLGPYELNNNVTPICTLQSPDVGEFGVYELNVFDDRCDFSTLKEPVNPIYSFIYVIVILACITIGLNLINYWYRKFKISRSATVTSASTTAVATAAQSDDDNGATDRDDEVSTALEKPKIIKPRLRSLDTFRGIAIVLMIFVNSGGGAYWWMEHSTWNGLHVADLVFPWFLWIMGVCIPMSIKSQLSRNTSKFKMLFNVFQRSVKLFAIGLCLNTMHGPKFSEIRIMGVLQRFGIAYFVVTSLHILLSKPINVLPQSKIKRSIFDVITLLPQWIVMGIFVVIHLVIAFYLPVPDCPTGYLGPGGIHEMGVHKHCIGGATGYIDRLLIGEKHIYQHPTAAKVYHSDAFDPEGLFGCLLTFLQVFLGVQCGMILIIHQEYRARIKRWLTWALVLGTLGGLLCLFSKDNGVIPVNKNLWSLSYVCVTSCFAFVLLTICYQIIDVKNYWTGSPLIYAGMNAIIMYVGHEIFHSMLPWHWRFDVMNTHFLHLVENLWNTILWICIAYYLYCKKIFYSL